MYITTPMANKKQAVIAVNAATWRALSRFVYANGQTQICCGPAHCGVVAAYDAATPALKAIKAVAKTDSHGNLYIGKQALRDAVFASKFNGASSPIACDQFGACAKFNGAVYEYGSSDPRTFRIGTNPKRIWP